MGSLLLEQCTRCHCRMSVAVNSYLLKVSNKIDSVRTIFINQHVLGRTSTSWSTAPAGPGRIRLRLRLRAGRRSTGGGSVEINTDDGSLRLKTEDGGGELLAIKLKAQKKKRKKIADGGKLSVFIK